MTPFAAIVGGGAAGFFGAALAHVLNTWTGLRGAENWLRGSYGTQFFPLALNLGILYCAIGAASGRNAKTALLGFMGPFLGIALPLTILSHLSMMKDLPRGNAWAWSWFWIVFIVQIVAMWGTVALIGSVSATTRRWRGALAAVIGSLAGYCVLSLFLWAAPSYGQVHFDPKSYLPPSLNLMDGMLSGAGLCLALSLDAKLRRNA